ncbi:jerky protein homolog-like isoform X1 [Neodiprion lecontei]|uniref:Jerky protein homolog-like isoform X1 n=2 Tax=Neodiprion lecontei TaxID=441921 RepID=A0ABM3GCT4_NEOLC|nr:jerky protein homolog-like isoform X1 [Neodiprion lecontei]
MVTKWNFKIEPKKKKNTTNFSSDLTPDLLVDAIGNQDLLDDPPRKKRKRFSFEEKKNILEAMTRYSAVVICKKYELSDRTLRKWKSEKEKIIQEAKKTNCKKLKKKSNVTEMDDAMFQWLVEVQDKGIPISGPMIRRQALIAKAHHPKNDQFRASEGWLSRFKKRKNIRCLKITGEKLSTNEVAAKLCEEELKKMVAIKKLQKKNIFNMAESDIYIKQVPSRTLAPNCVKNKH